MTDITRNLLENESISIPALTEFQIEIINAFEECGFLVHKQLEEANIFIGGMLVDLIGRASMSEFLQNFLCAVEKEIKNALCLSFEMFVKETNPYAPILYEKGDLNINRLSELLRNVYHDIYGITIFDSDNVNYEHPGSSISKVYLNNLFHYAGLGHVFLEEFFDLPFQEFISDVKEGIVTMVDGQTQHFIDLFALKFISPANVNEINSLEKFDEEARKHQSEFLAFLRSLFIQFARLRKCTIAILETHLVMEHLNEHIKLKVPSRMTNSAMTIFNDHLKDMLNDNQRSLINKYRNAFGVYFKKNFASLTKVSGFVGLLNRQTIFNNEILDDEDPFRYDIPDLNSTGPFELHYQQTTEDLRTLNRLSFVLENRGLLNESEWGLFQDKISSLLKSEAPSYISDVFELYFLMMLKVNGVQIELIPSQKQGSNDSSTCDYKIGLNIGADAKFLNGDSIDFSQISPWIDKVGSQVKNSIGWMGISSGGAVIGIRDKQFEFVSALRDFKGTDKFDAEEKMQVIKLIYLLYSEFRRHSLNNPEYIKFIFFYYIPETPKPNLSLISEGSFALPSQNEIMFIMSTKYASEEEINVVKDAFRPVANFLFKFDGHFYNAKNN